MLEAAGFAIRKLHLTRLIFPIAHPIVRWVRSVRWVHSKWPIKTVQKLFITQIPGWLDKLALPIPRYRAIEIVAEWKDTRPPEAKTGKETIL